MSHDSRGWPNICTKRCADGRICGLFYWYAWPRGVRRLGVDSTDPHVCRVVE